MIIVSNGFNKFHLAVAAAAADRAGMLTRLITGAYPFSGIRRVLSWLPSGWRRLAKFADRAEPLDERLVRSCWLSEAFYFSQYPLRRVAGLRSLANWIDRTSFRTYARESRRHVVTASARARVFHYRAGFGHDAAEQARALGMVLVCDHSLAHPALVEELVAREGRMPPDPSRIRPTPYWQGPMEDVDRADHVLVNSEYVKSTFLSLGYPAERVHVIYWGVDDHFHGLIPPRATPAGAPGRPMRFLFAGTFEARKGAAELVAALSDLPGNWELALAGPMAPEWRARARVLLARPNVRHVGALSRGELARLMSGSDVLVLPSRAEGSARVVFEAMACGCAVLTTPNAGTVVEDGINGRLVPPGDVPALRAALAEAVQWPDRVAAAGEINRGLAARCFRESHYATRLIQFYQEMIRCAESSRLGAIGALRAAQTGAEVA